MDTPSPDPSLPSQSSPPSVKRRLSKKRRWLVGGLLVAGVVGIMLPASAKPTKGPVTPEQVRAKMSRGADFAMTFLDGTDAQRTALDPVISGLANDMANYQNEGRALRASFITAVLADNFDEAHLEKVRAEAIKLMDRSSKRALQAIKATHAVLTPEQRAKLRKMAAKMKHRRGHAGHGR